MVLVSFKNISGEKIEIEFNPTESFENIAKQLSSQENFQGINPQFLYKGKRLSPTDTLESIKYNPSTSITVSFRREANNQAPGINEPDSEKIDAITSIGYNSNEAAQALKESKNDLEKAKKILKTKNESDPNLTLYDCFRRKPRFFKELMRKYLSNTNPELLNKIMEDPLPLLICLGIHTKPQSDDDILTDDDNDKIQQLMEICKLDRHAATSLYLRAYKNLNFAIQYALRHHDDS